MVKEYFEKIKELGIGKLVLIFFAGILLVLSATMDNGREKEKVSVTVPEAPVDNNDTQLTVSIENILAKIQGVQRVSVCITYEDTGERVLVSSKDTEMQKVIQQDAEGGSRTEENQSISEEYLYQGESPYVVMERKPKICGVLVVYEGDKSVMSDISEAVKVLTGVDYNKIKVLSMN